MAILVVIIAGSVIDSVSGSVGLDFKFRSSSSLESLDLVLQVLELDFGQSTVEKQRKEHQQTLGNGYVTLCDIIEATALCAKGPLLQATMDKFKFMVK